MYYLKIMSNKIGLYLLGRGKKKMVTKLLEQHNMDRNFRKYNAV